MELSVIPQGEVVVSVSIPADQRLTKGDLRLIHNKVRLEKLIKMRLDLYHKWTYGEMAKELRCSKATVGRMLSTSLFSQLVTAVRDERMSAQKTANLLDEEMPAIIDRLIGLAKGHDGAEPRDSIEAAKVLISVAPGLGLDVARFDDIEPKLTTAR